MAGQTLTKAVSSDRIPILIGTAGLNNLFAA